MAPTSSDKNRRSPTTKRTARAGTRPNRAQVRAAEIRTLESSRVSATPTRAETTATRRGKAGSRGFTLTPEAEMMYVRHDLQRLMITAGILFVVMIGLLLIVD